MQVTVNIGNVPAEQPRPEPLFPPTVKERPEHWTKPQTVDSQPQLQPEPQPEAEPAPVAEEHADE